MNCATIIMLLYAITIIILKKYCESFRCATAGGGGSRPTKNYSPYYMGELKIRV